MNMEKKVFFEKYESINEFVAKCNQPTHEFYKNYTASQQKGDEEFRGTSTYEEATMLLLNGDIKTADMIKKVNIKSKIKQTTKKNNITYNCYGFAPCVPRVLVGNPLNMLNVTQSSYKNSKVITICVALGAGYNIPKEYFVEYGKKILSIITSLESKGYRLNIYVCKATQFAESDNIGACAIKIKDSGKPLNLTKIAYPIAHPSMFRRHFFRWYEVNGEHLRDSRYGWSCNQKTIIKIMKQHISPNVLVTSFSNDYYKTPNEIIKSLEQQIKVTF